MQNAGMAALDLNWRYLAFDVPPKHLAPAISGAMRLGFIGLNLTVPHKIAALDLVDVVDDQARLWGAINTIRFEGRTPAGEWAPLSQIEEPEETRSHGFNTDAEAIARVIRQELGLDLRDARVLLLGAGGAARVAALRIAREGPRALFLVNRTASKAADLAAELHRRYPAVTVQTGYPQGRIDLVINGTALGLQAGDPLPWDPSAFKLETAACVFDMVYRGEPTPFCRNAVDAGCRVTDGIEMLLWQGAAALELWTGKPAPVQTMRSALYAALGRTLEDKK